MITQSELKELLHYAPETGIFVWIRRVSQKICAGAVAGFVHSQSGYVKIKVHGRPYQAHRLAWLYMTGAFPPDEIDHINGIRDDNRIANLRCATRGQNNQNMGMRWDNTSGYHGVHLDRRTGKWMAKISNGAKQRYIGMFDTPEAASNAYKAAKAQLHPFQPTLRSA